MQIADYVVLGGFTLVHQFCRIGAYAFTGGGTALPLDLPPYVLAAGNRAKPHGLNKEGLRRHGFAAQTIRALFKAYTLLVKGKKVDDEARFELTELSDKFPEVGHFVDFVENSKRGILR